MPALDIFGTATLNRVVDLTADPATPLLDKLFPEIEVSDSEKIYFDIVGRDLSLSPFVSPTHQGKVVAEQTFQTKSFQPAYIKDKTAFKPSATLKRKAGEPIGGNLSPADRLEKALGTEIALKKTRLRRRLEVMASEAVRTGKVTVSGDGFETMVVDFGRNAAHTVALAPGSQWGDVGVEPWSTIETWAETVADNSGASVTDIYLDTLAFKALRADADFLAALDNRSDGSNSIQLLSMPKLGLSHKGVADGVNIWVYTGKYKHPSTGVQTAYIPANTVILASEAVEGVQHFGAIQDISALESGLSDTNGVQDNGLISRELFLKSWTEDDPSVRYLMGQSAPLVVPYNPDATFCATVK